MKNVMCCHFFIVILLVVFASNNYAKTVEELLEEGDKYATEIFDQNKALEIYQEAEKVSPDNYEVLWRLSRVYVDIAEHLPSKTDQQKDVQLKNFQIAFDYADKSVKLAPDKSITYLRRAIANGKIALFKGVFTAIGLVKSVKKDLEKAIQLGNGGNIVQGVAHYVLGRTHAKVCEKAYLVRMPLGLGWGDMDVAEAELKKAISLYPNFRMFYYELAKVYLEDDNEKEAKEALNKLIQSPKRDEDDDQLLAEAKQMLKEIK